ncbi:hypothetical protein CRENBAI_006292 [Crenichthys baileyi]|uniref:Uncharacterized protein n=1 Tax=Crenichthys baileyi TaxID=28760 RepID=A0AAV9S017_9TELE
MSSRAGNPKPAGNSAAAGVAADEDGSAGAAADVDGSSEGAVGRLSSAGAAAAGVEPLRRGRRRLEVEQAGEVSFPSSLVLFNVPRLVLLFTPHVVILLHERVQRFMAPAIIGRVHPGQETSPSQANTETHQTNHALIPKVPPEPEVRRSGRCPSFPHQPGSFKKADYQHIYAQVLDQPTLPSEEEHSQTLQIINRLWDQNRLAACGPGFPGPSPSEPCPPSNEPCLDYHLKLRRITVRLQTYPDSTPPLPGGSSS